MSQSSFLLAILLTTLNAHAIIYGVDDRKDVYLSPRAERLAHSTATMVSTSYLLTTPDKPTFDLDFYLADSPYSLGLCKDEKFSQQPSGWLNCSGFLIGEDLLVTAGHCLIFDHAGSQGIIENDVPKSSMCESFSWVFDFKQPGAGKATQITDISPDRLYHCKKVIYAENMANPTDPSTGNLIRPPGGQHGRDFAIIQLDRKVEGREPLKLAKEAPKAGQTVTVVGYPSALPAKFSNGVVLAGAYDNYFSTNLDIMGGSSGSPVFNNKDEVLGIVVRGYPYEDYLYLPDLDCQKTIVCKTIGGPDCQKETPNEVLGTHVQKIMSVSEKVPGSL